MVVHSGWESLDEPDLEQLRDQFEPTFRTTKCSTDDSAQFNEYLYLNKKLEKKVHSLVSY